MVIEKLKEREDAKEAREDQEILSTLENDIKVTQCQIGDLEYELYDLFDQYFILKGEKHPDDYREENN